jgi:hypothetical protein
MHTLERRDSALVLSKRAWLVGCSLVCLVAAAGCGPVAYATAASRAEALLEAAQEAHAERHAPYEYQAAEAYLDKAREEAGEAAYEEAVNLAARSEASSQKAIDAASRRQAGEL